MQYAQPKRIHGKPSCYLGDQEPGYPVHCTGEITADTAAYAATLNPAARARLAAEIDREDLAGAGTYGRTHH